MKQPLTDISIAGIKLKVNALEIETTWMSLTDTGTVTIPANYLLDNKRISEQLKTGDKVVVNLGYLNNQTNIFNGYVSAVAGRRPIVIEIQDEMWQLKQQPLNISGNSTLKEFFATHFKGIKVNSYDFDLGRYHFADITRAQVLEKIKTDYGFRSFFRNGTLVVGIQYDANTAKKHVFALPGDPQQNVISDNLIYRTKDQFLLKVKAISNNDDGTRLVHEFGDPDGETRTLNYYNLNIKQLKELAQIDYERLSYDGFSGDFTAWGEPIVQQGDIVTLKHFQNTDRTGDYWVDKVIYQSGVQGIRQQITIGSRVSAAELQTAA